MALVRCPIHKIPYNDDNPRGCPACAREKDSKGRVSLMQELAKAQRVSKRTTAPTQKKAAEPAPAPPARKSAAPPTHPFYRRPAPVAPPPKPPSLLGGPLDKLRVLASQRRVRAAAGATVLLLVAVMILTSGPRFRPGLYPQGITGDPRPLPINPNVPMTVAFGALGGRAPTSNPDSPRLARYTYGTDLTIDAVNGIIYAISLRIPNRAWRGLQPGMSEQTARGTLALLGTPMETTPSSVPQPEEVGGYWVYRSLDARPRRILTVEVRPPNGCFDVQVELQPRAIGTLDVDGNAYAVVGRDAPTLEWVATEIRVVSRRYRGPYSDRPAC